MALSSRMQWKLRQAGFVNITGLRNYITPFDDGHVGDGLARKDVGMYPSVSIYFGYDMRLPSRSHVGFAVDMLIVDEPEIWIAPCNTFSVVKIRPFVKKLHKLVRHESVRYDCQLNSSILLGPEDFFMAANPQMGWRPGRKKPAPPLKPPTP